MTDIKTLEHPTLMVSYEYMNKNFRAAQKTIERELSRMGSVVTELEQILAAPSVKVSDVNGAVENLLTRLTSVKRKASESVDEESLSTALLKKRINYLKIPYDQRAGPDDIEQWNKERVDRMIIDHLLRTGYHEAAGALARNGRLELLANTDVFVRAREVEQSLLKGDTKKWTQWAYDNKSKLRRVKSCLELKIRRQEFVELVRSGQRLEAVKFARKYFSSVDPNLWSNLTPTMGLLAYNGDISKNEKYKQLLSEDRWKAIAAEFRAENLRLFHLTQPPFSALLQAGVSSMKTYRCALSVANRPKTGDANSSDLQTTTELKDKSGPPIAAAATTTVGSSPTAAPLRENNSFTYMHAASLVANHRRRRSYNGGGAGSGGLPRAMSPVSLPPPDNSQSNIMTPALAKRAAQCPLCQPAAREFVAPLALAHCVQSHLICAYSGEPMDDDNPPMVLPNGMVYGNNSLTEIASKNDGKIVCPRTKRIYNMSQTERVFIL